MNDSEGTGLKMMAPADQRATGPTQTKADQDTTAE
jgi:hypothetical protein